jgi:hypothetical protein
MKGNSKIERQCTLGDEDYKIYELLQPRSWNHFALDQIFNGHIPPVLGQAGWDGTQVASLITRTTKKYLTGINFHKSRFVIIY